jgi:hypothetical protein
MHNASIQRDTVTVKREFSFALFDEMGPSSPGLSDRDDGAAVMRGRLKLESLIDQVGEQADEEQLDAREDGDDAKEAQMPLAQIVDR